MSANLTHKINPCVRQPATCTHNTLEILIQHNQCNSNRHKVYCSVGIQHNSNSNMDEDHANGTAVDLADGDLANSTKLLCIIDNDSLDGDHKSSNQTKEKNSAMGGFSHVFGDEDEEDSLQGDNYNQVEDLHEENNKEVEKRKEIQTEEDLVSRSIQAQYPENEIKTQNHDNEELSETKITEQHSQTENLEAEKLSNNENSKSNNQTTHAEKSEIIDLTTENAESDINIDTTVDEIQEECTEENVVNEQEDTCEELINDSDKSKELIEIETKKVIIEDVIQEEVEVLEENIEANLSENKKENEVETTDENNDKNEEKIEKKNEEKIEEKFEEKFKEKFEEEEEEISENENANETEENTEQETKNEQDSVTDVTDENELKEENIIDLKDNEEIIFEENIDKSEEKESKTKENTKLSEKTTAKKTVKSKIGIPKPITTRSRSTDKNEEPHVTVTTKTTTQKPIKSVTKTENTPVIDKQTKIKTNTKEKKLIASESTDNQSSKSAGKLSVNKIKSKSVDETGGAKIIRKIKPNRPPSSTENCPPPFDNSSLIVPAPATEFKKFTPTKLKPTKLKNTDTHKTDGNQLTSASSGSSEVFQEPTSPLKQYIHAPSGIKPPSISKPKIVKQKTADCVELQTVQKPIPAPETRQVEIKQNAASRARLQKLHEEATKKLESQDETQYQTPLQRKEAEVKEIKSQLQEAYQAIENRETEMEALHHQFELEIAEAVKDKEEMIFSLQEQIEQLSDDYQNLTQVHGEVRRRMEELERIVEKMEMDTKERETRHQQYYLEMYRKGQESARFERLDELEKLAVQEPDKVSVEELLEKLELTQQDLHKWQTIKLMETYAESERPATEADAKLKFLRDSMFHYLTDKDRDQAVQHLTAIIGIFNFTDVQLTNIMKNLAERKKKGKI